MKRRRKKKHDRSQRVAQRKENRRRAREKAQRLLTADDIIRLGHVNENGDVVAVDAQISWRGDRHPPAEQKKDWKPKKVGDAIIERQERRLNQLGYTELPGFQDKEKQLRVLGFTVAYLLGRVFVHESSKEELRTYAPMINDPDLTWALRDPVDYKQQQLMAAYGASQVDVQRSMLGMRPSLAAVGKALHHWTQRHAIPSGRLSTAGPIFVDETKDFSQNGKKGPSDDDDETHK